MLLIFFLLQVGQVTRDLNAFQWIGMGGKDRTCQGDENSPPHPRKLQQVLNCTRTAYILNLLKTIFSSLCEVLNDLYLALIYYLHCNFI